MLVLILLAFRLAKTLERIIALVALVYLMLKAMEMALRHSSKVLPLYLQYFILFLVLLKASIIIASRLIVAPLA